MRGRRRSRFLLFLFLLFGRKDEGPCPSHFVEGLSKKQFQWSEDDPLLGIAHHSLQGQQCFPTRAPAATLRSQRLVPVRIRQLPTEDVYMHAGPGVVSDDGDDKERET